jgi:hypothetical protein
MFYNIFVHDNYHFILTFRTISLHHNYFTIYSLKNLQNEIT